jgi:hypothetical protein
MMTAYDATLQPPEPSDVDRILEDLAAALSAELAAASAASSAAGEAYQRGRVMGLHQARDLILAAATMERTQSYELPPNLEWE